MIMHLLGVGLLSLGSVLAGCAGGSGKGADSAEGSGDTGSVDDGGGVDGGDGGGVDGGGDGVDDDCDGAIDDEDDGLVAEDWFGDGDGDGYGSVDERVVACSPPDGYQSEPLDCDGSDPAVHPGATEICNTVDDDCDGSVDEDVCAPFLSGTVSAAALEGRVVGYDDATMGYFGDFAGDIDGDGVGDLLAGTSSETDEPSSSGETFVVLGPITTTIEAASIESIVRGQYEDEAAGIPSGAGDVHADGYDDILVRSHVHTYLISGPVTGPLSVADADAVIPAGDSPIDTVFPHGVGDTNGDGFGDVMVGNTWTSTGDTYYNGEAWLYRGPVTGLLGIDDADATLIGPYNNSQLGYIMEGAGDMDGDGLDDVAVSAHYYDSDGAVFLQYAPLEGDIDLTHDRDVGIWHSPGTDLQGEFSTGADFNGDGHPDLLVGAPDDYAAGEDAGAAFLFYGPLVGDLSTDDAEVAILGQDAGAQAGTSVQLSADMNRDGYGELAVVAYPVDEAYPDPDSLYVFHGPLDGTLSISDADLFVTPPSAEGWFGPRNRSLSAGDVTGDGYPDLVFGAPTETLGDTVNGVIWVLPGGP